MKRSLVPFLILFGSLLFFSRCANKGSGPDGGPKDSIPPIMLKSNPENFTTHFTGNEIKIYFDEYIKLKDLQQNLIVSPPLKYQPIITPITSAKVLKIKILDTLKENTTYAFNFGKSIVDNNEENPFEYFKYVFSTGDYIDSLTVKGTLSDALLPTPEKRAAVMLYEINEHFTDSIIYSEKPAYVATTKEKDASFELTNLKEGTYLLVALEDSNSNYTFEPKKDKIAFVKDFITVPKDTSYHLTLFKEIPAYKMTRPSHVSKNKIAFGFEGTIDSLSIKPISQLPGDFTSVIIKDSKRDTLNYWFKPAVTIEEIDTLGFVAKNHGQIDTLLVKMRELYADSLTISRGGNPTVIPRDSIKLSSSTPLVSINAEKMQVMDPDSTALPILAYIDSKNNEAALVFPKKEDETYQIRLFPGAITDFFGATNDTLSFGAKTKLLSDYGTLRFSLQNIESFPVLVELVDSKFKPVASEYLTENKAVYFDYLEPNNYYLRIVYDTHPNKKWDTGDILQKIQPEKIVYFPKTIEIKANWDMNEVFILE